MTTQYATTIGQQRTDESLVTRIVQTVADENGTDPLSLPPLYSAIDGDALDDLCEHAAAGAPVSIEFTYADCRVTVSDRGNLDVQVEPVR